MSIHFSLVTVTVNGYETDFFAANTPWSRDDLEENDDFLDFLTDLDEAQDVSVHVEDYIYGEGEVEAASVDELADIAARVERDPAFLSDQCDNIADNDFSFCFEPEEGMGQSEFGQTMY